MRTLLIVGLVVGPVVVLGAPLVLTSGVTLPPDATPRAAFVLAGIAAVGGILLLALSFRPRRRTAAPEATAPAGPATTDAPASVAPALAPLTVVHNARPGRYVPSAATPVDEPDPVTAPARGSRERIVTLQPRRHPQSTPQAPSRRATVGVR